MSTNETHAFYQSTYKDFGFKTQRMYPNEELCRFMGRKYFDKDLEERKNINMLEVGCGSGANLWMLAKEGFNAFGLDESKEALTLCKRMLSSYSCKASLTNSSMTNLPYEDNSMDVIIDIFSSNCISDIEFEEFGIEVHRVLKPEGYFFTYFPSKNSDAWKKAEDNDRINKNTLKGILREQSPFFGNNYPFRFLSIDEYEKNLFGVGLQTKYKETVSRTYNNRSEYFEFIVIEAQKLTKNMPKSERL